MKPQNSPQWKSDNIWGIVQGDILIRTAIIAGIKDMRANPGLLDYAFQWLPKDPLTAGTYGMKTLDKAKEWFLRYDIPVTLDVRLDKAKSPLVTITLAESAEESNTLGDIHYESSEFLDTLDGPNDAIGVDLESAFFRESYQIGCYAQGEPEVCLWLWSIITFILLRYRKTLLERRGYERTHIQSGPLVLSTAEPERENWFTRAITISGYVMNSWPQYIGPVLTEVDTEIVIADAPKSPPGYVNQQSMFIMEGDMLAGITTLPTVPESSIIPPPEPPPCDPSKNGQ